MRTRAPLKTLLLALALLPMAGCGPFFYVEADIPKICKTLTGLSFPGLPPGAPTGAGAVTLPTQTVDLSSSLPDLLKSNRFTGNVRLLLAELDATSGDLGFLDNVSIVITTDDPTIPPLAALDYTKDPSDPTPTTIDLSSSEHPNLFPYVKAGALNLSVTVAGELPTAAWAADVKVCISADAKFQYL